MPHQRRPRFPALRLRRTTADCAACGHRRGPRHRAVPDRARGSGDRAGQQASRLHGAGPGADTVDANLRLGLPADSRDYTDAGAVLATLGVHRVRLLSNNPRKADGLRRAGVQVDAVPLPTAAHVRNAGYLQTKAARLGHVRPSGSRLTPQLTPQPATPVDVATLLGPVRPRQDRPYVLLKYAQTLDGRIATRSGDSKWISGEPERQVSHGLRAAYDAVLVGAGTVRKDDPQLTVRLVPGATPMRVVLSTRLGVPRPPRSSPTTRQPRSSPRPTPTASGARPCAQPGSPSTTWQPGRVVSTSPPRSPSYARPACGP